LLASLAVWLFFVRRKRRDAPDTAEHNHNHNHNPAEPASAHGNWYPPAELQAAQQPLQEKVIRSELSG